NGVAFSRWLLGKDPFDPFPFIFFNLLLSIVAAFQGPVIMMSQNRQGIKDRAQAETDFKVNLKNEIGVENIQRGIQEIKAHLQMLERAASMRAPEAAQASVRSPNAQGGAPCDRHERSSLCCCSPPPAAGKWPSCRIRWPRPPPPRRSRPRRRQNRRPGSRPKRRCSSTC